MQRLVALPGPAGPTGLTTLMSLIIDASRLLINSKNSTRVGRFPGASIIINCQKVQCVVYCDSTRQVLFPGVSIIVNLAKNPR